MALVQHASGTTNGATSVVVTLGAATTPGNCLIACFSSGGWTSAPTVSTPKIGSSTDNWALAKSEVFTSDDVSTYIYTDQGLTVSSTSVTVGFTSSQAFVVDVFEWSGILSTGALDKTNGATTTSTTWTSGSSGTLTKPKEVAFGCHGYYASSSNTITGPGSGWTNESENNASSGGFPVGQMCGYQQVNSTSALTYNGTDSNGSIFSATAIITLLLAAPSGGLLMLFP